MDPNGSKWGKLCSLGFSKPRNNGDCCLSLYYLVGHSTSLIELIPHHSIKWASKVPEKVPKIEMCVQKAWGKLPPISLLFGSLIRCSDVSVFRIFKHECFHTVDCHDEPVLSSKYLCLMSWLPVALRSEKVCSTALPKGPKLLRGCCSFQRSVGLVCIFNPHWIPTLASYCAPAKTLNMPHSSREYNQESNHQKSLESKSGKKHESLGICVEFVRS